MSEVEFIDETIRIKNMIETNIEDFLNEIGGEVVSLTKRNSRVDTGQTKGSWKYVVNVNNKEVVIGSNLQNAIWEEFGTGEYALGGKGRKGGWHYKDAKGNWHFTKGKTPNRPLYRAITNLKPKIERRMNRILEDLE